MSKIKSESFDVSVFLEGYDLLELDNIVSTPEAQESPQNAAKYAKLSPDASCDSDPYASFRFDDTFLDDFSDDVGVPFHDVTALTAEELEWLQKPEEEIKNHILELAEEIERETAKRKLTVSARDFQRSSSITLSSVNHQNDCRKRRLCRHFLKGHCKRGNSCDFLHDTSIFCDDEQKVFLGGLPAHITAEYLCLKLNEKGYQVINKPKVLRGFTPQVCLATVEQAQQMIEMHQVYIDGCPVDVRPYEDRKPPDDLKRSVFLGGLPNGIMVQNIKRDLSLLGVRVCNHPILKAGFVPQVVLASPEEAQRLIKAKKVMVGGKLVEVRPYVNFRKRY